MDSQRWKGTEEKGNSGFEEVKSDTIAAISTPYGFGGIGVVRLSGPAALFIAQKVFSKKLEESGRVSVGYVFDPQTEEKIDTALAIYFKAPHSYTGEDIVELQMHGGIKNLEYVLKMLLRYGARIAERGEFTKRAFLNGKMDLIEARAVLELIEAKTERSMKVALKRLFGALSDEIYKIKKDILSVISMVEGPIDFPFDVEEPDPDKLKSEIGAIRKKVKHLISSYNSGKRLQNGVKVAIVGKPNVGKSTLLNALLKFERAIVSEIPGTTRDTVEETVDFFGIPVRFIDTAGVRETDDTIERIGRERSLNTIKESDVVLFLFDSSDDLAEEDFELAKITEGKDRIIVLNKTDLPSKTTINDLKEMFPNEEVIGISALKKDGVETLEKRIFTRIAPSGNESLFITTEREKQILEDALSHLEKAEELLGKNMDELVSEELKEAVISLGVVTGENAPNEILDSIFSRFCIGK